MTSPCWRPASAAVEPSPTSRDQGAAGALGRRAGVADLDAEAGVGGGLAGDHLVDDRHHLVDGDGEAEADRAAALAELCEAVRMEELMPTTAPVMSTSGPPELPGLIAASVWIAGYVVELPSLSEPTLTGRSSALTMPLVTVESRPNGRAEGHHVLADVEVGRLPDGGGGEVADTLRLDDGGVGERVGAEDLGRRAACRRRSRRGRCRHPRRPPPRGCWSGSCRRR